MKCQLFFSLLGLLMPALALAQIINFDNDETGKPPKGFSLGLTGKGKTGVWIAMKDATAPSQPHVLAQTDMEATSYRFPLCIFDGVNAADVDLSVKFKPVKGKEDQAAGLLWRYRDQDNYYIVRANALENNVVLYKVEKSKRTDLDPKGAGLFTYGKKAKVPSGEWNTLRVVAQGNLFAVYLNREKLFEVEDNTFIGAGKVGLWTKADSYILFDDLTIIELKSGKQN
ncbi:MAG: family 16 glycoside hydrolase [bacterium]